MRIQLKLAIGSVVLIPLLLVTGCASSGPSPEPMPVAVAPTPAPPAMQKLYEAGDYAGTVRAFLENAALANQDLAVFRAAVASALPGHAAHDPARALALFNRLVTAFPESDYLTEARLVIGLLQTAEAMRGRNDQLEQELEQMKAIDLGQQP